MTGPWHGSVPYRSALVLHSRSCLCRYAIAKRLCYLAAAGRFLTLPYFGLSNSAGDQAALCLSRLSKLLSGWLACEPNARECSSVTYVTHFCCACVLQEQMNKTYLEAYKLDLLTDNVELRNRLQSVEKERSEFRDKLDQLQVSLSNPSSPRAVWHYFSSGSRYGGRFGERT